MTIQAVVFDVGETLVDETRQWTWWAERLDVPVFLRRGPWAFLQETEVILPGKTITIDSFGARPDAFVRIDTPLAQEAAR